MRFIPAKWSISIEKRSFAALSLNDRDADEAAVCCVCAKVRFGQ